MSTTTELALTESKDLRRVHVIAVPDAAYQIPGFEFPKGRSVLARQEVAEAFDVPDETIRSVVRFHGDELREHGMERLLDKALGNSVGVTEFFPARGPQVLEVFTPTAVAVVGMLLTGSRIARTFRTEIIKRLQTPAPAPVNPLVEILRQHGDQLRSISTHPNGQVKWVQFQTRLVVEAPKSPYESMIDRLHAFYNEDSWWKDKRTREEFKDAFERAISTSFDWAFSQLDGNTVLPWQNLAYDSPYWEAEFRSKRPFSGADILPGLNVQRSLYATTCNLLRKWNQ